MKRLAASGAVAAASTPLAELLQPLSLDGFFRDCWDIQPVLITGPAGRFTAIMREQDFERAIFDAKLSSRSLRFLHKAIGSRTETLDLFLRKKAAWTRPQTISQLASELHKGTLVYVAIENAVPSVKSFSRSLFNDFRCPLSINAYFSAGRDASAFDAHFDPQDTFVLQLAGEKEWRLWERERVRNPISGYPAQTAVSPPALPADEAILMTPGDLLYVPRGTWHWPRSLGDAPSLHLTLTVVMPRPVDIMLWLTDAMASEPEFRVALPMSPHQQTGAELKDAIDAALASLAQRAASPGAANMAVAYMLREAMGAAMSDSPTSEDGRDEADHTL